MNKLVTILTFSALPMLGGCLYGDRSSVDVDGRAVSENSFATIELGASRDAVLSAFGEPSTRRGDPEGREVWEWRATKTTEESSSFLFLWGTSRETSESELVIVEFENGKVVRTSRS